MVRLIMTDKYSVVVRNTIEEVSSKLMNSDFIFVQNNATGRFELYNKRYIKCIRQSSEVLNEG